MKNNELQNIDNYNKSITNDEIEIYLKYTHVIAQYLLFGIETIKNHNSEYVKYILNKGLFTISYVFKMLLMYTCNLELAYHHCQKSYSYYIEFIGQIGDDAVLVTIEHGIQEHLCHQVQHMFHLNRYQRIQLYLQVICQIL